MTRERIFSVTIHDCEVQTFRAGGRGGQHQNKTDSGARVIHHPSGARGECRQHREQPRNKRAAFIRMTETPKFKAWLAIQTGRMKSTTQLEAEVERDLTTAGRVRVEVKDDQGRWVDEN